MIRVSYRKPFKGVAEVEPGAVDVVVGAEQRVVDEVHRGVDDDECGSSHRTKHDKAIEQYIES